MEVAEYTLGLIRGSGHRPSVGDVQDDRVNVSILIGVPKRLDRGVEMVRTQVRQYHPHSLSDKGVGDTQTDPAASAGNEGNFAAQILHPSIATRYSRANTIRTIRINPSPPLG